jgi:hypothetical protein
MKATQSLLRLAGSVIVVLGGIVGVVALILAGNPETDAGPGAWVVVVGAFGISGGVFWLLRRTGGATDRSATYQPSSVVGEVAVPILTKVDEVSRPFTQGGLGIITIAVWAVAILAIATLWIGITSLLWLVAAVAALALDSAGIALPDPVSWLAMPLLLIAPIAVVITIFQWARRRPAIRYWMRW